MLIEKRIEELGYVLPEAGKPLASYIPVKQLGNALFVSGQVPMLDGKPVTGKVGRDLNLEGAQAAARLCILNLLAAVRQHTGDLDAVKNIVKLQVFVNSETGFLQQHLVANAASEMLYDIFGEKGRHARTALGTNQIPLDVSVEIEAILEL